MLLRHPLFVAIASIFLGALGAYWLTERWQRWRQRREFQYRAFVKFNELAYELAERMSELLVAKSSLSGIDLHNISVDPGKQRALITRWMVFEAMCDELRALFDGETVTAFYRLRQTGLEVKKKINTPTAAVVLAEVEPVQDQFLAQRELTSIRMMADMGFLKGKRLRAALRVWESRARALRPFGQDGREAE